MALVDKVKPYIAAIEARQLSIKRAAEILKTDPTYLCKVLKPILKRKQSTTIYRKNRTILKKSRGKFREMVALEVRAGRISVEIAAETANCSVRTIYRYLTRV